ncbi:antibiotic resistance protein MarC [Boudabousia liubingyangii]|uniref:UPF0056 membrane protein n=1 Tax=Boudabousia liubingyangii TaxID=1921764 RepID=A0A1Q5PNS8_9ACTO|nr:MarC family protein [Boudabousia liubingyangii]OKL47649.1 antibiotic resistance protein MarC [Boudabousia liubingyangii]OKL49075.1 antibiotic resistance protein MarC [Boudabousia liubingyangii]
MATDLFLRALAAFFAIMNPFVNLPVFLGLTSNEDPDQQRRTGVWTIFYTTILCCVFFFSGSLMLNVFGIDIDHFRIAGGLVLLMISLGMLRGSGSATHEGSAKEKAEASKQDPDSVAFYPMSFPMLVGPGSITTIIVFQSQAQTVGEHALVFAAMAIVLLMLLVTFYFSGTISRHMSLTLRTIMARLMGMVLVAISIEMMANGLARVFPGLVK